MDRITKINRRRVLFTFLLLFIAVCFASVLIYKTGSKKTYITLYFTDHSGKELFKEKRNIEGFKNIKLEKKISIVLKTLFAGPLSYNLEAVLPSSARVCDFWIVKDFLYINLVKKTFTKNSSGDFAISSINKTIFKNFQKINKIKYLVEGRQISTSTGFEDISYVFFRSLSK
jgi:hypothetical protein